jgi:hypothetical protein
MINVFEVVDSSPCYLELGPVPGKLGFRFPEVRPGKISNPLPQQRRHPEEEEV